MQQFYTDTDAFEYAVPFVRPLSPADERAMRRRVMFLEAFQDARRWEFDKLEEYQNELAHEHLADQSELSKLRELLWIRGVFHE